MSRNILGTNVIFIIEYIIDVNIELDRNKLMKLYKIIPYDFFIHSRIDDKPKSNTKRESTFEFEEIILKDINNVMDYIISIDFQNNSILDRPVGACLPILRNRKIIIYNNGEEY
jgi:hypothetical protein